LGGEEKQVEQWKQQRLTLAFLPSRQYGPEDVIVPSVLVEIELADRALWVLMVPNHGGLISHFGGKPVQVLTPQSPLGEALLGKKIGDRVSVALSSGERSYLIRRIF
jgi:Transcription elongation factor, GreA/GreB, C-term